METSITLISATLLFVIRLNFISLFAQTWNYKAYRLLYRKSEIANFNKVYQQMYLTPPQVVYLACCFWKITKKSLVKDKPYYKEVLELSGHK